MQIQIFQGNASKDGQVSLALQDKIILSVDGCQWNKLKGVLVVNHNENDLSPVVQLECLVSYKPSVGVVQRRIVYTEFQKLTESDIEQEPFSPTVIETPPTRKRFKFSFSFGSKALLPSFQFSDSKDSEIGVFWTIYGYMAQIYGHPLSRETIKISSNTSCRFIVAYHYTRNHLFQGNQIERSSKVMGLVDWAKSIIRHDNLPQLHSKHDSYLKLLNKPLKLEFLFHGLLEQDILSTIEIYLKQHMTFQSIKSTKTHFKYSKLILNQEMTPVYNILDDRPNFSILLEDEFKFTGTETCPFLLVFPEEGDSKFCLVSSTLYSKFVPGKSGINIEYKIQATVNINRNGTLLQTTIFLPLIISHGEFTNHTVESEEGQYLSRKDFLPILSSVLEDISNSCQQIEVLKSQWRNYRHDSSQHDRMVTESSDHALFILEILNSLTAQLKIFIENLTSSRTTQLINWPEDAIPFNMFLLELELLIRALPHSPAYTASSSSNSLPAVSQLLDTAGKFLKDCYQAALSWIQPKSVNSEELCKSLENNTNSLREILFFIAEGGDTDFGVEVK